MTPSGVYHELIGEEELQNCRNGRMAEMLRRARVDALAKRSGGLNVASATLHAEYRPDIMAYAYSVRFDSSAWTGR